jgi:hypothetical protein
MRRRPHSDSRDRGPGGWVGWLNPPGATAAELKSRTLTNLYNQRPTWLTTVYAQLDNAVFEAYDWPADLGDEEILARLLELNLSREPANHGGAGALSSGSGDKRAELVGYNISHPGGASSPAWSSHHDSHA